MEVVPQAMRAISDRMRSQSGAKLSVPQLRTLLRLRLGAKTNKQLAEEVGLSVAATSRLVQQLAVLQLVTRKAGDDDRRNVWLALSPKGEQKVRQSRADVGEQLAERLKALSRQEKKSLHEGLKIIISSLC